MFQFLLKVCFFNLEVKVGFKVEFKKMLSILIPVYNFQIKDLVIDLARQCQACRIIFEIRCYDDQSEGRYKDLNRQVKEIEHVVYEELEKNIGRAAIRNRLADDARYSWLLFMDCDSSVVSANYLKNYLEHLSSNAVLCGGRVYADREPEAKYHLHWQFGKSREQLPAARRAQNPYQSFMTNNFMIPKSVFSGIRFEEKIIQYGHEDTLFGIMLQRHGIEIIHLDNPLEHVGLEERDRFLEKTIQAIQNLHLLRKEGHQVETKLVRLALAMERLGIAGIIKTALGWGYPFVLYFLKKPGSGLFWLDIFKLYFYLKFKP